MTSLIAHHTSDHPCSLCEAKLSLAHPELANWFRTIKPIFPDCHVSWSYRNQEEQEQAFLDKKTDLHFPDSAHNKTPAMALDLFEINEKGQAIWSPGFFTTLAILCDKTASQIFWGGRWKCLGDNDHFELRPKIS